jgi:small conductance mechanosensitive channel
LYPSAQPLETVTPGKTSDGIIVNVTARDTRRVDMVFGIDYGDDLACARDLILEIVEADEGILKDPAPAVALADLADSSVNAALHTLARACLRCAPCPGAFAGL